MHVKTTHVLLQPVVVEQLAELIKRSPRTCSLTTLNVFIVDERLSSFIQDSSDIIRFLFVFMNIPLRLICILWPLHPSHSYYAVIDKYEIPGMYRVSHLVVSRLLVNIASCSIFIYSNNSYSDVLIATVIIFKRFKFRFWECQFHNLNVNNV